MESLFARALAIEVAECRLPSGEMARVRRLRMHFGHASPDRLPEGALPSTYTSKPLVTFKGAAMFGELALVKWLAVDGWDAVWVDTLHDRKFWRGMPTTSFPVALPAQERLRYDQVVAANGGRASGAFNVMAWKGAHTVFLDYEGPDDVPSRNRSRWMKAALGAGVSVNDLLLVTAVD